MKERATHIKCSVLKVRNDNDRAYGVDFTLLPTRFECGKVDVPQRSPVPIQYPGVKSRGTGLVNGMRPHPQRITQ